MGEVKEKGNDGITNNERNGRKLNNTAKDKRRESKMKRSWKEGRGEGIFVGMGEGEVNLR